MGLTVHNQPEKLCYDFIGGHIHLLLSRPAPRRPQFRAPWFGRWTFWGESPAPQCIFPGGSYVEIMPLLRAYPSERICLPQEATASEAPQQQNIKFPQDICMAKETRTDCSSGLSSLPDLQRGKLWDLRSAGIGSGTVGASH